MTRTILTLIFPIFLAACGGGGDSGNGGNNQPPPVGIVISHDLFCDRIPFDRPTEPDGDVRQMAGGQSAMMRENVRDRFFARLNAVEEVLHVGIGASRLFAFVEAFQRVLWQRMVSQGFDGGSCKFAAPFWSPPTPPSP